jgi:hypothetical protein
MRAGSMGIRKVSYIADYAEKITDGGCVKTV